ncbi:50S ribosomal protein L25/general stress protein Ctc [Stackebrandtia nassauensis]|uniref:Large ribosomal subunit protein bL25 n=1 Tax=Stackebrandtia nassauensis (strain DSM 44728 / CIP 108903 / NRRL B-16338 / NBRC 102104 / LLR-40K-21) TaxID=446470 RepID=D3PU54_STANL|nr:50S ribosomal protein L25/general stress protein Ctc [Stackebrandtia nassauensis]ADD41000.1 ribosomal 5S rRNA E-loop binding protein Ctc/L25/TL5 [Stackebrandtia nassauensis DSM 44728]
MSEVRISAEPRTEFGKGGARRTRRAGKIPAVLYGHGEKPKHLSLPAREFAAVIRRGGLNQLVSVEITDGTTELALPKALQRDPIKDTIEHVDLLLVRKGEKVTVEVRIDFTGEPEKGGLIVHNLDTLTVEADATAIPESVELSIEGMEVGSNITAAAVNLPSGTTLVSDPETVLVTHTQPRAEAEPEGESEGEDAAEAAEGEKSE